MQPIRDVRVAIGFLTRIPVGDVSGGDPSSVRLAQAVPWFPLVGAAIGLAHGAAWRGLVDVLSPAVAAALATALALLITGAFHHDGLADMADAFGGGWTVEQRFEILKDSRLGTYGTSALGSALVIEVVAVAAHEPSLGFRAIVAAHVVGRAAALLAMVLAPVAGDGLGASYTRELSRPAVGVGVIAGLVVAVLVLIEGVVMANGLALLHVTAALVAAGMVAALVVLLSVRKIGGVTGDVLGAITVCTSLAVLVVTSAGM